MKKFLIILIPVTIVALLIFFKQPPQTSNQVSIQPTPATESEKKVDFTASFEIYTNQTKRIFTDSKYHNLSANVYITSQDPSLIYVKKEGVTWADFFATLPMKLTKECLVTGTKQTFCNSQDKKLRFYINSEEQPNALNLSIKPQDKLLVTFGPV